jgi:hypothetical protein
MEFTQYFKETRIRPDRAAIKMDWIESTVLAPDVEKVQSDGRIRK